MLQSALNAQGAVGEGEDWNQVLQKIANES